MELMDLHPRTLRRNIWSGLLCASDQEIQDGMDFYPGAHGLCRLFASLHPPMTSASVAGIYAALSPMNTWDTNVANVLDVLRLGWSARVNTTNINLWKALAISYGADPEAALGQGRKVRAFYRAIADPENRDPIPVDRHLMCLAIGEKITSNEELRALVGSRDIYSKVEDAYAELGAREGIGNRLAAIAWFVQRRIEGGQRPLFHPDSPVHCGRPMQSQGKRRFLCRVCGRSRAKTRSVRRSRIDHSSVLVDDPPSIADLSLFKDPRGYVRVYLGVGHPSAGKTGSQYLARYIIEGSLGRKLRRDEHTHHVNGVKTDCRLSNLEVWLAERHGRHHAKTQLLYMYRDEMGRFVESDVPAYSEQVGQIEEVPF